jgi:glyoxylase-like metal-dependent hydrolase (beta-lactamase superfamily II)
MANINLFRLEYGLQELPGRFKADPADSRLSAEKIGDLEPELVCFGHGPLLNSGSKFQEYVGELDH